MSQTAIQQYWADTTEELSEGCFILTYIHICLNHFITEQGQRCTKAAPKVMPPVLLCWFTTSGVDAGSMAVGVEPSHQYAITCCWCVTDGSRGAVWPNGVQYGSVAEAKVCHWVPPCGKCSSHWCLLTLAKCLWRPVDVNTVSGKLQQRWQQHWVTPLLVQIFTSTAHRLWFTDGKNA